MFIKDFLDDLKENKIKIYVDMDGVIADFDVGNPSGYDKKRPLYTSIDKLKKLSEEERYELHILSICRMKEGFEEKNSWLDKFAPFFKKENRHIIVRELNGFKESSKLKQEFVTNIERDGSKIVIIDDDIKVIRDILEKNEDVLILKDTALVD